MPRKVKKNKLPKKITPPPVEPASLEEIDKSDEKWVAKRSYVSTPEKQAAFMLTRFKGTPGFGDAFSISPMSGLCSPRANAPEEFLRVLREVVMDTWDLRREFPENEQSVAKLILSRYFSQVPSFKTVADLVQWIDIQQQQYGKALSEALVGLGIPQSGIHNLIGCYAAFFKKAPIDTSSDPLPRLLLEASSSSSSQPS